MADGQNECLMVMLVVQEANEVSRIRIGPSCKHSCRLVALDIVWT